MLVILKEGFELKNSKGDTAFAIEAGTQLTTIRRAYISQGSKVLSLTQGNTVIENLDDDNVFVYMHQHFIAIPLKMLEIPVSTHNGWRYNI